MKKIITIVGLCVLLVGCGQTEEKKKEPSKAELLEEVLALDTKMKELESFKLTEVSDEESLVCGMEGAEPLLKNANPKEYTVIKDGEEYAYKYEQKIPDEMEYRYEYFKQGKRYTEYSLLPGDIEYAGEGSSKYLVLNRAVDAIDTRFYTVDKQKDGDKTIYTMELSKPKEYNDTYPDDYNDEACGLSGDYVNQKIMIIVSGEGFVEQEVLEETIRYSAGDKTSERLNTTTYTFHDYNGDNTINFYFIKE